MTNGPGGTGRPGEPAVPGGPFASTSTTEGRLTDPLPRTFSTAEVASALGETENFVKAKCRAREWPHLRGARGRQSFTAEQYRQVLELCAAPVEVAPAPRVSFAPRSRRSA